MGDLGNAGAGACFKSDSKDGSGNSNVAGILADFLDEAGKPGVTCHRLFLRVGQPKEETRDVAENQFRSA
jgi:hypothetical protein